MSLWLWVKLKINCFWYRVSNETTLASVISSTFCQWCKTNRVIGLCPSVTPAIVLVGLSGWMSYRYCLVGWMSLLYVLTWMALSSGVLVWTVLLTLILRGYFWINFNFSLYPLLHIYSPFLRYTCFTIYWLAGLLLRVLPRVQYLPREKRFRAYFHFNLLRSRTWIFPETHIWVCSSLNSSGLQELG